MADLKKTNSPNLALLFADDVLKSLFIATKNLMIKRLELSTLKRLKTWQLAVNKDGTRLVSASGDTVLRLWHIGPKEGYTTSCRGHNSIASLLQFHPSAPYFFSSAVGDHNVIVWNAETGSKVATMEGHQGVVTSMSFDAAGQLFATCSRDKVFILWNYPGFAKLKLIPAFECLEAACFLPIGALQNHLGPQVETKELLLTAGQWGCLRVWDPESGRCLLEIKGPLDRCATSSHQERQSIEYGLHSVVSLQLASIQPDSPPVLALVRQSNHIELYDPTCAKLLSECLGDIGQVDQLCIVGKSRNHLLLADASPHLKLFPQPYGLIKSGQTGSWMCYLVPGGHSDVITDLVVSSCGEWVASGSKDQSLCVWHVVDSDSTGKLTVKLELVQHLKSAHAAHVTALCFNKATNLLLSASEDNVLKAWKICLSTCDYSQCSLAESSVVHAAHKSTINDIDISINDQLAATASRDKTVKIWTIGKRGLECSGVLQGHRRGVWSVRFSSREKLVLTASGDGDVKLWNLKDFSCIRTYEGHDQPVYKAVFISDERQFLSCDQRGLVRLWDVGKPNVALANQSEETSSSSPVFEAHEGRIWSLVLSPDQSGFYTGGEDETLCYFRDVTEETQLEKAKEQDEFIQTNQLLNNLIASKQFSTALRLAIKLDQPKRTLDLLQELLLSDSPDCDSINRLEAPLDGLLSSDDSTESLVQRLLGYVINWNTRARTSSVAQCVLNWILSRWPPEELIKWPGMARTVESLIPYTDRHYQRISRLEEQLAILDYLCDLSDEHQVSTLGASPQTKPADDVVELDLCMETDS